MDQKDRIALGAGLGGARRTASPSRAVHNGTIENSDQIKAQLQAKGVKFRSDTDTEVHKHESAAAA